MRCAHAGEVSYYLAQSLNQAGAPDGRGRTGTDADGPSIYLSVFVCGQRSDCRTRQHARVTANEKPGRNPPPIYSCAVRRRPTDRRGPSRFILPRVTFITLAVFQWAFIHSFISFGTARAAPPTPPVCIRRPLSAPDSLAVASAAVAEPLTGIAAV